ncbi:hypothetical protein [Tropicimonas sediminicola]|uniref:Uncharacterized protein n=1 Tax=Tropicimonas sediminicola TaxID=1031541 RepID=A0A239FFQ2_9RHOB|nr:hypothetical protein [Tropicimonas sediminicola]SNS54992.1 hypothetical protein SAMN05421757_102625 [Tropicimonas sediminicola]
MISIGSSPFLPAVGGPHSATAEDRRATSPSSSVSPTSRVAEGTVQGATTAQPDPRVLQPVPAGGPSATDRTRSEPERPLADLGERGGDAQGQETQAAHIREPVPPLTQFVEIPTETTAEIQRLREEARSARPESDAGIVPASASTGPERDAAQRIGTSLSTMRQIQAPGALTLDITR